VVFIFVTHLNAFGSNMLLALKIMNFEDALLTKVIHFYMKKKWMHNIHDVQSKCRNKMFKSITIVN
jgi:hypothetical protein